MKKFFKVSPFHNSTATVFASVQADSDDALVAVIHQGRLRVSWVEIEHDSITSKREKVKGVSPFIAEPDLSQVQSSKGVYGMGHYPFGYRTEKTSRALGQENRKRQQRKHPRGKIKMLRFLMS